MSKVSIIGAYNTKFGAFVEKNRETGEVKDMVSYYDLLIEAGKGALADAGLEPEEAGLMRRGFNFLLVQNGFLFGIRVE